MDQKILWAVNKMPKTDDKNLPIMGLEEIKKARTFHESFPQYSETPLTKLPHMASYLGVKEVYVKDESYRFGLNAFKVLGGFLQWLVTSQKKPERMFLNFLIPYLLPNS